ncbi:MAG: TolB-like protein/cytochrome c-type biogenesis protein CcmH/NrfG [Gammaproteobacteria bacterium]|jgi:TolB-like protein/cytochrome c-type biogenesis protein CcmH/NrfG
MDDSIVRKLYERKMFRITAGYLAVAWVLWQVVTTTCPAFECSTQIQKSIFWYLLGGLPFTLAIAWLNWKTAIVVGTALLAGATVMFVVLRGPAIDPDTAATGLGETNTRPTMEPPLGSTEAPLATEKTQSDIANSADFGGRPAIAVLPFENLSADPDQAFFADGLAEDLITRLSSWRAFPVIARSSSFNYRGGEVALKRIAEELGVRYVVEGSVRRAGDRIRVAAQLIDGTSGEHLWAETYDREITDVFALQDEMSTIIAASLVGDLTRAEGERAHQRGTNNLEAWSLYQLGLQKSDRFTRDDFAAARRLFERAAELDGRFATALGEAAVAAYGELMLDNNGTRAQLVTNMMANARRAVELDARDPAAHLGLGVSYLAVGEVTNALESIKRAVELNPSMPDAWIWLGFIHILAGNPDITLTATTRAQQLNPQGPMVWIYDNYSLAYWELGRYKEGLDFARRLVAVQPSYFTGYAYIAMNAVSLGRLNEARAAITEGRKVQADFSQALMQNYFGVSRPKVDQRRNEALDQAGLD